MLFTDADQLREFIAANVQLSLDTVKPHIIPAQREYLQNPWLGFELMHEIELIAMGEPGSGGEGEGGASLDEELVKLAREVVANFTFLKALPFLEVNIGDAGIVRTESEHAKTAFRGQIARIENSLKETGWNALENLLLFLDKYKASYPLWVDAPGYIENNRYFFSGAVDFARYFPLKFGRVTYQSILPAMRWVEFNYLIPRVGSGQLADLLLKLKNGGLSAMEKQAVELLKTSIAFKTIARSMTERWIEMTPEGAKFLERKEEVEELKTASAESLTAVTKQHDQTAEDYLQLALKFMMDNAPHFPIYAQSVAEQSNTVSKRGGIGKTWFA
jgi:hypothetical protein